MPDSFMTSFTDIKGTFHAKMGAIKDRNGMHLTEAEDIKKGNKVLWFRLKLKMYWASLVPQMVKNLPAMQETWV